MNASASSHSRLRHHHHQSQRTRRIWKIVRVLACALCVAAVANFIYLAYRSSDCFVDNPDPTGQRSLPRAAVDSAECRELILRRDLLSRLDAVAVLVSLAIIFGTSVSLSQANHRTKRLVLAIEAVIVLLAVVYSVLWIYAE